MKLLILILLLPVFVLAQDSKVNVCHATGSTTNPYEAIRISINGWENGHSKHDGDFLYEGPTREDGQPLSDGWCEEHDDLEPQETIEPEPENNDILEAPATTGVK